MTYNTSSEPQVSHTTHMDLLGAPKAENSETVNLFFKIALKHAFFYIFLAITFDILYHFCLYFHIIKIRILLFHTIINWINNVDKSLRHFCNTLFSFVSFLCVNPGFSQLRKSSDSHNFAPNIGKIFVPTVLNRKNSKDSDSVKISLIR